MRNNATLPTKNFWETGLTNNATYMQYYEMLVELSVSMFEWKNLPDTIDPRFLELTLFGDGKSVFFKDDVVGYLALRCAVDGRWDLYNIPTDRRAYATNGYQQQLNEENSVLIFNNYLHTNSMLKVANFARRLYELDKIIEVNAKAQKTPVLIQCDEKQRLTMRNLYQKYEGNEPYIFGDKNLNPNAIKVLKTDAPYIGDKIYQLKTQIWNEALTYLGISNTNVTKKERMISDEVIRNMGGTIASRYSRLESRRQACDKINNMFGLNIECNYREDYREADDEIMLPSDTEEESMKVLATDLNTTTPVKTEKGGDSR